MLRFFFCFLLLLFFNVSCIYAFETENQDVKTDTVFDTITPTEYISEDDSNFFYILPPENTSHSNPNKQLTVNEKFRNTFHLPKPKKIYYHNVDKTKQPVSNQHYEYLAKDIKRSEFKIPEPKYERDAKIISPDPHYIVERFNTPPGAKNIELHNLYNLGSVHSQAILAPDKSKLVYTSVYSNGRYKMTGYEAHNIPISDGTSIPDALKKTHIVQQDMKPIVSSLNLGVEDLKMLTLFPLDWSKDGKKIAFKEQIGSTSEGVWNTNVIVYDFDSSKSERLDSLREAIIYWWRVNKKIDLKNYMWDLFPLGWSKENPDNIVFYAYAFTKGAPFFLGTWSIDFQDKRSKLISIDSVNVEVDLNGFGLKLIEHSR